VRPRDGGLEGWQVDLAQRTLVDVGADSAAVVLLVIGVVMLDVGDDVLGLDAVDVGHAQLRGEVGVLAERLEVASPLRHAHDVDHGREDDVVAQVEGLAAENRAVLLGQTRVPGRGERGRGRQRRGLALVRAHARRAIREGDRGDAQPGVGRNVASMPLGVAHSMHHGDLLVEGHAGDKGIGPLIGGFGRVHPGGRRGGA